MYGTRKKYVCFPKEKEGGRLNCPSLCAVSRAEEGGWGIDVQILGSALWVLCISHNCQRREAHVDIRLRKRCHGMKIHQRAWVSDLSSSRWGLFHSWIALPWRNYVDDIKMLSKFLQFSPFFLTTITFKWSLSVGHLNECSQKPKLVIQLKATKVHLSSLLTCKLHLLRGQHFLVRAKDQIQSDHWNSLFCLLG